VWPRWTTDSYSSSVQSMPRSYRTESSLARCTISFPECIAALDAALAGLIPRLEEGHPRLRIVMLANNEIVMK